MRPPTATGERDPMDTAPSAGRTRPPAGLARPVTWMLTATPSRTRHHAVNEVRCEYRLFAAQPEMVSGIDFGLGAPTRTPPRRIGYRAAAAPTTSPLIQWRGPDGPRRPGARPAPTSPVHSGGTSTDPAPTCRPLVLGPPTAQKKACRSTALAHPRRAPRFSPLRDASGTANLFSNPGTYWRRTGGGRWPVVRVLRGTRIHAEVEPPTVGWRPASSSVDVGSRGCFHTADRQQVLGVLRSASATRPE